MNTRRGAPRFNLRVPVVYRHGTSTGEGMIWNISTSGARIERASIREAPGTSLLIHASFFPGSFEVELPAEVVRETDEGFSVRFIELQERELSMLKAALPAAATAFLELQSRNESDECPGE